MRAWLFARVLGLSALTVAAVHVPAGAQKQVGWFADYAAARAEARRTGKPLFVVFRCQP